MKLSEPGTNRLDSSGDPQIDFGDVAKQCFLGMQKRRSKVLTSLSAGIVYPALLCPSNLENSYK